MKRFTILAVLVSFFTIGATAQNDTMYVMKNGAVIGQYNVNTEVDSVIFYKPEIATTNAAAGIFTDSRDGNEYKWVKIGDQVWMAENLAYLPSIIGTASGSGTTPYYYVYDYSGTDISAAKATSNYTSYGVLYNWPAAMSGSISSTANPSGVQGVCPTDWHLPSDNEWTELTDYLGGTSVAGGKLKETSTTYWNSPNTEASNKTGFTALPGGNRVFLGTFANDRYLGYYWGSTEGNATHTWNRIIYYNSSDISRSGASKESGYSVRCVKD